jgi:hypothetical protein
VFTEQYYVQTHTWHRISQNADTKCGKYKHKLTYTLQQRAAFTVPVVTTLKSTRTVRLRNTEYHNIQVR